MLYNLYGNNSVFMICKDANARAYFKRKFVEDYYKDYSGRPIDMYIQNRICTIAVRFETMYADRLETLLNSMTFKN